MLRKPSGQPTDRVAGVPELTDLVGLKFPEDGKIHGFTVTESLEALYSKLPGAAGIGESI